MTRRHQTSAYDDACTRLIHSRPPEDESTVMDSAPISVDHLHLSERLARTLCRVQSYGTKPGYARLITIRYSHYNERARWALDLAQVSYTEDHHPPGFAQFAIQEVTEGRKSASPALVLADGEVVTDSGAIVRRLHQLFPRELGGLYPPGRTREILSLEDELALTLGARARQLGYAIALDGANYGSTRPYLTKQASLIERCLFAMAGRRISAAIVRIYNCRASCIPSARLALRELFARLSQRLEDNAGYLCGDTFTAADLTFAALSWPVVFPQEWDDAAIFLPYASLPHSWREIVDELRATPAGRHAARMYAKHRFPPGDCRRRIGVAQPRRW